MQVDETTGRESDEAAPVLESAARTVAEETGRIADAPDVAVAEPSGSPIVAGGVPRTRAAAVREDVAEAVATAAATGGAVTTAAVGEQVARFGDPVQRAQERIAGLLQEQVRDTAETTRRLMTCTSLPAAIWLQIDATGRTAGRMVAQGQAVAALGRDMLRAIGPSRRR